MMDCQNIKGKKIKKPVYSIDNLLLMGVPIFLASYINIMYIGLYLGISSIMENHF